MTEYLYPSGYPETDDEQPPLWCERMWNDYVASGRRYLSFSFLGGYQRRLEGELFPIWMYLYYTPANTLERYARFQKKLHFRVRVIDFDPNIFNDLNTHTHYFTNRIAAKTWFKVDLMEEIRYGNHLLSYDDFNVPRPTLLRTGVAPCTCRLNNPLTVLRHHP